MSWTDNNYSGEGVHGCTKVFFCRVPVGTQKMFWRAVFNGINRASSSSIL